MGHYGEPFVGSEALASGALTRHQLRTRYRRLFPDVYLADHITPTLRMRISGAWLWSGRQAIIAGQAAAALHGARWVDDDIVIELLHANGRAPRGVIISRGRVLDEEMQAGDTIRLTTPERTAFDLGRRGPLRQAVARLDALMRATAVTPHAVAALTENHPNLRGLRQLDRALTLADPGAESPPESYLRLTLIAAGFPRPRTQIPVHTAAGTYYLDMGWEDLRVAVEYDGEHHRTDPVQWAADIERLEILQRMGWIIIRVTKTHRVDDIVARVAQARAYRGAADLCSRRCG